MTHRTARTDQPHPPDQSYPSYWSYFGSAVIIYALLFHHLGDRELWSSHEARAAQEAQRMLDDGDWKLPRLYDDQEDLQKPPLYYWLVAGVAWLRGAPVDGWAVRLPSALAAQTAHRTKAVC